MYSLLRLLPTHRLTREQIPALGSSWVVAEMFYKFGSFTLELAAFLVTWFCFDLAIQWLSGRSAWPLAAAKPPDSGRL